MTSFTSNSKKTTSFTSKEIMQTDKAYISGTYNRFPLVITQGKGSICKDCEGKEYIDFTSGIGVNSLGFCNDEWLSAITNQAATLNHCSNLYYSSPCATLAKELCNRSFGNKVCFGNSGAEANECAIKAARKYSSDKYGSDRSKIITLVNSFHGRTLTTLSATGQETFHKHFGPFTQGFSYALAGDFNGVKNLCKGDVCAIILELIQGEGGVIALDKSFVQEIYNFCICEDILLIIDEVQTGIGRTGSLFAYENYDITPDIITIAKGLGSGLPIGAAIFGEKCENVFGFSDHGTTFGGNPICCAGGLCVLETISSSFLNEVAKKGDFIRTKLSLSKNIQEVSGMGMMLGISLKDGISASTVASSALANGLLVLTAKTKVRLLPALNISQECLEKGMKILTDTIDNCNI